MNKKPHKVADPKAPYAAKKPAKGVPAVAPSKTTVSPVRYPSKPTGSPVRYATPEQVRKAADEVFKVHSELFRKLAQ